MRLSLALPLPPPLGFLLPEPLPEPVKLPGGGALACACKSATAFRKADTSLAKPGSLAGWFMIARCAG